MHDLRNFTSVQIVRLYNKAWSRIDAISGDLSWDWPTLSVVHPGYYRMLQSCRWEMLRRLHS